MPRGKTEEKHDNSGKQSASFKVTRVCILRINDLLILVAGAEMQDGLGFYLGPGSIGCRAAKIVRRGMGMM
jgi:hypothetical protein